MALGKIQVTSLAQSGLVAFGIIGLYAALRQQTWSLDGVLHTLASTQPMDAHSSGHLLLRPVSWAWTTLWAAFVPLDFATRYQLLHVLFAALGVAGLTLVLWLAARRGDAVALWLTAALVVMSRDMLRHITTFDEKPLGMFVFAIALLVTHRLFARLRTEARDPTAQESLALGAAWTLSLFGHLQHLPFAAAAWLVWLSFYRGPGHIARWARHSVIVGVCLVPGAIVLAALLHTGAGGFAGLFQQARHLFLERPAPAPAVAGVEVVKASLLGCIKAFFLVDRLSPVPLQGLALLGAPLVYGALAWGARRAWDPLSKLVVGGSLGLMLLMPAVNFFPEYGDSYTSLVMASPLLLVSAPRALLAVATLLVLAVNLPAAVTYAQPGLTMQQHLQTMVEAQSRERASWVLLEDLSPFDREQGLAAPYYAMWPALHVERASLASLPESRFLLELPTVIGREAMNAAERVAEVQRELARSGRKSRLAQLYASPRVVRSDFRRYGDYLVVEARSP